MKFVASKCAEDPLNGPEIRPSVNGITAEEIIKELRRKLMFLNNLSAAEITVKIAGTPMAPQRAKSILTGGGKVVVAFKIMAQINPPA